MKTYQIKKGESLAEIAKRYGVTAASLATVNGLRDPYSVSSPGIAQVRQAENDGSNKGCDENFVSSPEVSHADWDGESPEHGLLAEARGERHGDTQCRCAEKQSVIHYVQQP